MTAKVFWGDCRTVLRDFGEAAFSAACFSPPYDVGSAPGYFDVRKDFRPGGAFIPYALEISRVSVVWAINLAQRVDNKRNLPFIEELVLALEAEQVQLFDRWVIRKRSARPSRGERALADMEFLYLFSAYSGKVRKAIGAASSRTVIDVKSHGSAVVGALGASPYYPEIPRQMFALYGAGGVVLDPFCGSGTSLLAATALGLDSVGVELNEDIWQSCRERVGAAQRSKLWANVGGRPLQ